MLLGVSPSSVISGNHMGHLMLRYHEFYFEKACALWFVD